MNIKGVDYVTGQFRGDNGENMVTHLYMGNYQNPGYPMCSRGWHRKWYDKEGNLEDFEYSIFRNNVSKAGICRVCIKRAEAGLPPIKKPAAKKRIPSNNIETKKVIMKFIPIYPHPEEIKAIIDGRKSQMRMVVKTRLSETGIAAFNDGEHPSMKCPYGQPGDILWVRESFYEYGRYGFLSKIWNRLKSEPFRYVADDHVIQPITGIEYGMGMQWRLKSSIHMPKEACRIFLKVKSVRVERLQDISEEDAIAEGVEMYETTGNQRLYSDYIDNSGYCDNAIISFETLFESMNGPESWEANPWVWVIEFERVERPEGFI